MADVFDNSSEKKEQISQIAANSQKAILCQGDPRGIYLFLDSDGNPNKQNIDYPTSVDALLFTSSNRVCLLEKTLDNGGKQWILKGNGDYKLTYDRLRRSPTIGINTSSASGIPPAPSLKEWEWSLDWIKSNYQNGSTYTSIYNSIENSTPDNGNYGISGQFMSTKEFFKNSDKITDSFKIGYFEEYLLTNLSMEHINHPEFKGTVAKHYQIFNFTNNIDMYNNIVNLGFIPLCRKPSSEGTANRLNPAQSYYDEDKPVYGYHRFYNILITSNEEQALDYINNGTIPDDARIPTDSSIFAISILGKPQALA